MNFDFNIFMALATAHFLGDFVFQSDKDVANRQKPTILLKHAAIVASLSYLMLGDPRAWWPPVVIFATHYLIDRVKVCINRNGFGVFLLDQILHLAVIMVVTLFPVSSKWEHWYGLTYTRGLIFVTGLVLTTHVGGVIVGMWVQPYLNDLTKSNKDGEGQFAAIDIETQRGLMKGGRIIGQLERGLIFFLMMIGKPESVAFLIAAKSVFRFGELKDHENRVEAEYITIGTMMSFTWGLVVAWLTWWIYARL